MKLLKRNSYRGLLLGVITALFCWPLVLASAVVNPQSGSVGVQGIIPSPPPSVGATITIPSNGQVFTELPIRVSGICPDGLLIKMFKNNVFAGSVQCINGSYSIQIDLFNGVNELIARDYDALDQSGPDSNTVSVSYTSNVVGAGSHVSLTSNYAKRGANPGEVLTWPIILSGGTGPYALSVDWGDSSKIDLISREFAGEVDISHTYENPGAYNIVVKASDKNGGVAYLQLVAIANGPLTQDTSSGSGSGTTTPTNTPKVKIVWQPALITIPFILSTFWLGKRYELFVLRRKIERGVHPFK